MPVSMGVVQARGSGTGVGVGWGGLARCGWVGVGGGQRCWCRQLRGCCVHESGLTHTYAPKVHYFSTQEHTKNNNDGSCI